MPITYNRTTSRPDDSSTQAGPSVPPISMTGINNGDLVIIYGQYKDDVGIATITMSATAGQVWISEKKFGRNSMSCGVFWCKWSTTAANGDEPTITVGIGTVALTAVLMAFSPSNAANTWQKEADLVTASFVSGTTPFTKLINGLTTSNNSTVTVASWFSTDDNTWSTATATGWTNSGDAQYRNLQGTDQSSTYAYCIRTTSGFTGNVSKDQLTLGGDAGMTSIMTWYETSISSGQPYSQAIII